MGADKIKLRFGAAVRAWREELGLSQEQAAARCELSVRYWRAIEAGEPSSGLEVCDKVLRGLGQSWEGLAQVLDGEIPKSTGAPPAVHKRLDEVWKDARAKTAVTALLDLVPAEGRDARPRKK